MYIYIYINIKKHTFFFTVLQLHQTWNTFGRRHGDTCVLVPRSARRWLLGWRWLWAIRRCSSDRASGCGCRCLEWLDHGESTRWDGESIRFRINGLVKWGNWGYSDLTVTLKMFFSCGQIPTTSHTRVLGPQNVAEGKWDPEKFRQNLVNSERLWFRPDSWESTWRIIPLSKWLITLGGMAP